MKTIEIASYPKSGNTWLLRIIENFFDVAEGKSFRTLDIHTRPDEVVSRENAFRCDLLNDDVCIYKSHILKNPLVNPDLVIYLYRHPLDVFLSALNFLFHRSEHFDEARIRDIWLGHSRGTVEQIMADGNLEPLFQDFNKRCGANYWPKMLGKQSNHLLHVEAALSCDQSQLVILRYEDLIQDAHTVSLQMFERLFQRKFPHLELDLAKVDEQTKGSGNDKFFWKAKAGNYKDVLTPQQIAKFEKRHLKRLGRMGYL